MKLDKILKGFIFTGIFTIPFLPLVVSNSLFFPFITGKAFAFRIITEIIFALWLILIIRSQEYRPRKSFLIGGFVAVIAILGLSTIFSEYSYKSFWSNFERMEGFIGYLHYLIYFLVFSSMVRTKKVWVRFLNTSVGVSAVVSFYGLAQLAGYISIRQGGARIDSTLGNATYLAVFMLFNIFFIIFFLLRNWKSDKENNLKMWVTVGYGSIFLLNFNTLYNTATRGSILAFLVGGFVLALLLAFFEKGNLRKVSIAALVALFVIVASFFAIKDTQFVKDSQTLHRFANISASGGSAEARFLIWGVAWEGVKERPVLGWGLESYNFVFNKHYKPILYKQEVWFDRAHNFVFDWLIAGGFLGLLAFLSLSIASIYYLWFKNLGKEVYEKALWTSLIVAYLFNNLFVFDNLISSVLFISLIAYLHSCYANNKTEEEDNVAWAINSNLSKIINVCVLVALSFSLYFVNIKPIQANILLIQGLSPKDGSAQTSLNSFRKLFNMKTFANAEASEHLLVVASNNFRNENIPITLRQEFLSFAESKMLEQIEMVPNDARRRLMLGSFYRFFLKKDLAIAQLEKAYELSPGKQIILVEMGQVYSDAGDIENALRVFAAAYDLEKTNEDVGIAYASILIKNKRLSDAEEIISSFLEIRNQNLAKACEKDSSIQICNHSVLYHPQIVNAYAEIKRFDKVLTQWQQRLTEEPNDLQAWLSLAATYIELGDRNEAIKTIQTTINVNPNFETDGKRFIEQIQNGSI